MKENESLQGNPSSPKKKMTSKQIAAIIGIILLIMLYLVTLLVAIFDRSSSGRLFQMCIAATIAVPIMIWIYTWIYGKLTNKSTIADWPLKREDESE